MRQTICEIIKQTQPQFISDVADRLEKQITGKPGFKTVIHNRVVGYNGDDFIHGQHRVCITYTQVKKPRFIK